MSSYLTLLFILICCCYLTDCTPKQSCHSERIQKQVGLVVYNSVLSFCRSFCIIYFCSIPPSSCFVFLALSVCSSLFCVSARETLSGTKTFSIRKKQRRRGGRSVGQSVDVWTGHLSYFSSPDGQYNYNQLRQISLHLAPSANCLVICPQMATPQIACAGARVAPSVLSSFPANGSQ